ncbi:MAG: hypothetical protein KAR56_01100 [Thermoplasmata archaeon]|nr:hypothetical protein [Thermoplasmata archaeon]
MKTFCPGHITGLFSIEDSSPIKEKKGSVGIGFCIQLGATAEVNVSDGEGITIFLNEIEAEAPVTRRAIEIMVPDLDKAVEVKIEHEVPTGQGFGMSAAGTFAACLAFAIMLEIPDPKHAALRATHLSEIKHRTGLGDAVAQSVGGFVHRIEPGIPPHGEFRRIDFQAEEVLLCILGDPIKTSEILAAREKRSLIQESGHARLYDCENSLDLASFISSSWAFATDAGLATDAMKKAIDSIKGSGHGSMAMLGNSIFAFGDVDALENILKDHGQVFRTNICQNGAICF